MSYGILYDSGCGMITLCGKLRPPRDSKCDECATIL